MLNEDEALLLGLVKEFSGSEYIQLNPAFVHTILMRLDDERGKNAELLRETSLIDLLEGETGLLRSQKKSLEAKLASEQEKLAALERAYVKRGMELAKLHEEIERLQEINSTE